MSDETKATKRDDVITKQAKSLFKAELSSEFDMAVISGRIEGDLEYSHEVRGEKFYRTRIRVERLSGREDLVPIVISDLLIGQQMMEISLKGKWVEAGGQFKSENKLGEDNRRHLYLFLFVTNINIYENEDERKSPMSLNLIYLDGYICKQPLFRTTHSERRITDFIVAVNSSNGEPYHIPCIAWSKFADLVSGLEVGNQVQLYGRIQSRVYFKRTSPDSTEGEYRIAYEVSAMNVQCVDT